MISILGFVGRWTPDLGPLGHGAAVLHEGTEIVNAETGGRTPISHLQPLAEAGTITLFGAPIIVDRRPPFRMPVHVVVMTDDAYAEMKGAYPGPIYREARGGRWHLVFASRETWAAWASSRLHSAVIPTLRTCWSPEVRLRLSTLGRLLDPSDPTICAWRAACSRSREEYEAQIALFWRESIRYSEWWLSFDLERAEAARVIEVRTREATLKSLSPRVPVVRMRFRKAEIFARPLLGRENGETSPFPLDNDDPLYREAPVGIPMRRGNVIALLVGEPEVNRNCTTHDDGRACQDELHALLDRAGEAFCAQSAPSLSSTFHEGLAAALLATRDSPS